MSEAGGSAAAGIDTEGDHAERPGPAEFRDPFVRQELKRAAVWIGCGLLVVGAILLAEPLMIILGGFVFASILDGGTRLLGRVLPIGRGWRLAIISFAAIAFIVATFWLAGVQLAQQAQAFRTIIVGQADRLLHLLAQYGISLGSLQTDQLMSQAMSGLGRITTALTSALGGLTTMFMILVLGLFIAIEPKIYERGFAWLLPLDMRENYYRTSAAMGSTLRRLMAGRLLGMAVEGVATWLLLWAGGVPMAALLGIITGILAFLPNIGAIISGVLIVLVGFSMGVETGLWAIAVYAIVQFVDGYIIVPYVARKTVDLAPALVLGAQLIFGALFGILGLTLADPVVAMIKAALQQRAVNADHGERGPHGEGPAPPGEPITE